MGEDVRITITLMNLAEHQILFAHRPGTENAEFSYIFIVKSAAGRIVEETTYGREARERADSEGRTVDYVQPGQNVVQTVHLAKLVNLSKPGEYRVRATRRDPETHTIVVSNEIVVNVVP